MENKFHDVLSSVDAKQGRSSLEPYGELVDTLREQGLTCRDIAAPLPQHFAQRWSDDEIRRKIAEKKARKPVAEPAPVGGG